MGSLKHFDEVKSASSETRLSRPRSRGDMAVPLTEGCNPDLSSSKTPEKCIDGTRQPVSDKHIYYWDPKSLRIRGINFWHVFVAEYLVILSRLGLAIIGLVMLWQIVVGPSTHVHQVVSIASNHVAIEVFIGLALFAFYCTLAKPSVYCIDNTVFVPPEEWQVSHADLKTCMRAQGCYSEDSLNFMTKILDKSATGETTHWPPGILPSKDGETPMNQSVGAARHEAEVVILTMVQDLLEKTRTRPKDIDFLIVNCSLFSPTPSLCAMVCHKFKMKEEIKTYNLGGMGCSANLISIDLAKQLLQNSPGCKALVVSTENLTQNLYMGNEKSMLLQNTLFRCGGCAQLLSSCRGDFRKAKYKLLYTGRTQMTDEDSFKCVYEQEDVNGKRGVALSKDIVNVAGKALKQNFTRMGYHVLPIREQAKTIINRILIGLTMALRKTDWAFAKDVPVPKAYVPNFKTGIDHWCIHAGGRAVIEGVQKNLRLQEQHIAPSMQTLYDWGNTSSSSIWYEAEWVERLGGLKRGHRVLQIAFGSGFKCNSAVWLCLRVDESKQGIPLKGGAQVHDRESNHVEVSLPKVSDKGE